MDVCTVVIPRFPAAENSKAKQSARKRRVTDMSRLQEQNEKKNGISFLISAHVLIQLYAPRTNRQGIYLTLAKALIDNTPPNDWVL